MNDILKADFNEDTEMNTDRFFTTGELNLLLILISNYDVYDSIIDSDGENEKYFNVEKDLLKDNITTKLKYALLKGDDDAR